MLPRQLAKAGGRGTKTGSGGRRGGRRFWQNEDGSNLDQVGPVLVGLGVFVHGYKRIRAYCQSRHQTAPMQQASQVQLQQQQQRYQQQRPIEGTTEGPILMRR